MIVQTCLSFSYDSKQSVTHHLTNTKTTNWKQLIMLCRDKTKEIKMINLCTNGLSNTVRWQVEINQFSQRQKQNIHSYNKKHNFNSTCFFYLAFLS